MPSISPTLETLQAGLAHIIASPADAGRVELIVRRPKKNLREVLTEATLDTQAGLLGDCWPTAKSWSTDDGSPNPDAQITLMNSRVIALIAGEREHWPPAGDQFYVDFDLSATNLPPGTKLLLGAAELEVTAEPHTGCRKFLNRFGPGALQWVNSAEGRRLNLRGINAKVLRPGVVRPGDFVRKA